MPFYKKQKILFIHIPKTGGTSVEKYFSRKFNTALDTSSLYFAYYDNTIQSHIRKQRNTLKNHAPNMDKTHLSEYTQLQKILLVKQLQHSLHHFTWNEIREYKQHLFSDKEDRLVAHVDHHTRVNYDIITIVRNPYDRIISELLFIKLLDKNTIQNKHAVYLILKEFLESDNIYDNHKLPQHEFISNETNELLQNVTILHTESLTTDMVALGYTDFNLHLQTSKYKIASKKTKYSSILNTKSIQLINTYYKRDFEIFGYELLTE